MGGREVCKNFIVTHLDAWTFSEMGVRLLGEGCLLRVFPGFGGCSYCLKYGM